MPVNAPNNELSWEAPNFNLFSVDDNSYNLRNLKGQNGTVIAFICNHCPYVIKIANTLSYEAKELKKIGVSTIAIMSNNAEVYKEDSFENMKLFAKKYDFKFPYLYDQYQQTAKNYGAICTPDIFGFNKDLKLKYRGRLDSRSTNADNKNIKRELFCAMELISKTNEGPKTQFNSFGCSIKWIENE
jgi:peroxiredoxin